MGEMACARLGGDRMGGDLQSNRSVFVSPRTRGRERGSSWPRPKKNVVSGTLLQSLINSWEKYSNHHDFVKNEGTLGIISLGPSLHFSGQRTKVQSCC